MSLLETHRRVEIAEVAVRAVRLSEKTTWMLLKLTFSSGGNGWGEATCFGDETELAALVRRLNGNLRGSPARDLADISARVRQTEMSAARLALASALEQAWLDALARTAEVPLYALLGGAERETVPFYANINRGISDRSPEGFATQAARVLAETGAGAVKIAPFDGFRFEKTPLELQSGLIDAGLRRVAAVKAELGEGQRLLVDCHARFSPFQARALFRELGELGVYWVEEPCAMLSLAAAEQRALRGAAHGAGLMLAGAETVVRLEEMSRVLADGGHDVVLPDLRLTGVAAGMAMLRLASAHQVATSLHNPVGPVLDAVSQQVAAALPSFLILERQVGESPKFDAIRRTPVPCASGAVRISGAAGIGFSPDETVLEEPQAALGEDTLSFSGLAGAGPDA